MNNILLHNLDIPITVYRIHQNQITKNRQPDVMKHLNNIIEFAIKNKKNYDT